MKKLIYAIVVLFLLSFNLPTNAIGNELYPTVPAGIFGYQEKVGDKVIPFNWQAQESNDGVTITVFEDKKAFYNLCTPDGETLKWRITEKGKHDIQAVRQGNTLLISGIRNGKEFSNEISIDERPWYQPLSFSLGKFLNSTAEETSFWVIRADNIEVTALTAKKMGEEVLHINGEDIPTQKVEIRAEGFFSKFWSARYWYRKGDNLFMRYQSVHGLPGTDETIVELVKSPETQLGG